MLNIRTGFNQFANVDINDMSWLAPNSQFQFDPQLFGDYREPQDSVLSSGPLDDSFFNEAFDFATPYNVALSPAIPKKDLIAEIDAAKEEDSVPALLTCNKIWCVVSTPQSTQATVADNSIGRNYKTAPRSRMVTLTWTASALISKRRPNAQVTAPSSMKAISKLSLPSTWARIRRTALVPRLLGLRLPSDGLASEPCTTAFVR